MSNYIHNNQEENNIYIYIHIYIESRIEGKTTVDIYTRIYIYKQQRIINLEADSDDDRIRKALKENEENNGRGTSTCNGGVTESAKLTSGEEK